MHSMHKFRERKGTPLFMISSHELTVGKQRRWVSTLSPCPSTVPSASHPLAHAAPHGTSWEPLSRLGLLADSQSEICLVAGGVVTDFDGDGMLDLILSHGESMAQPLSVFRGNQVCMDPGTCRPQPSVYPGSRVTEGRRPGMPACPAWWKMDTQEINSQIHSKPPRRAASWEKPFVPSPSSGSCAPKLFSPSLLAFPSFLQCLAFQTSPCSPSLPGFLSSPSSLPAPPAHPCHRPASLPPTLQGFNNNWLRVVPRTQFGAFARGAKVVLYTKKSGAHLRIIDGGSGYLCEMEPVAHFGLGESGLGEGQAVSCRAWTVGS